VVCFSYDVVLLLELSSQKEIADVDDFFFRPRLLRGCNLGVSDKHVRRSVPIRTPDGEWKSFTVVAPDLVNRVHRGIVFEDRLETAFAKMIGVILERDSPNFSLLNLVSAPLARS
jgi:hypothetical protein